MAEYIGNDEVNAFREGMTPESPYDPDFEVVDTPEVLPEGLHFIQTSTTNPSRPRTVRAAYDSENSVMYVVFPDGTYWFYNKVDAGTWGDFKAAASKGSFLWENGFDPRNGLIYDDQGPVDLLQMSTHRRAALSSNLNRARSQQMQLKGKQSTRLGGKGVNYRLRGQGGLKK